MTNKLVILNNAGSQTVEMVDGKEYVIKHGENIISEVVSRVLKAKRGRNYKFIAADSINRDIVCPLCGQIVKAAASEEKITPVNNVPEKQPVPESAPLPQSEEDKLLEETEKKQKEELLVLAKAQGIEVDGRWSVERLKEKLDSSFKQQ